MIETSVKRSTAGIGIGRKMLVEDWINILQKCGKVGSDGCKHRKVTPGLEVSF